MNSSEKRVFGRFRVRRLYTLSGKLSTFSHSNVFDSIDRNPLRHYRFNVNSEKPKEIGISHYGHNISYESHGKHETNFAVKKRNKEYRKC